MAIQRYQRAGLQIADQPRIDPIGLREGARTQQMLSQAMDRVAGFAFERAQQEYQIEAKRAGAELVRAQGAQPTLRQLAEQGGPTDLMEREAFAVANRIAAAEVETEARVEIDRLLGEAETTNMDFTTFQQRITDIQDGFPAALVDLDPENAAIISTRLQGVSATALSKYGEYTNKQAQKDAQGRALLGIAQRQTDVYKLAASENDPESRDLLINEQIESLAQYMRDLQFDESAISQMQIKTLEQARVESIIYDFQNLETVEDKQEYLTKLRENPPSELGVEATRSLNNSLRADLNNEVSLLTNTARDLKAEVRDMRTILTEGGDPGLERLYTLGGQIQSIGGYGDEVQGEYNDLLMLREATLAFRKMNPGELQRTVNEMRQGMPEFGGEGVDTLFETEVIKTAEGMLRNMNTRLEEDPLSFAAEVGAIQFTPIDFQNPANLEPSIAKRKEDALRVSRIYATEPRFLTDEESSALVASMKQMDRVQKAGFLGIINEQFGRYTPDVLAELSNKAPDLAHVGGLVTMGKIESVGYALQGQDLIAQGNKAIGLTPVNTDEVFGTTIGQSLTYQSGAKAAGRQVAEQIYTAMAFERGLVEFDDTLWNSAVQMAFGFDARTGRGGIQEVRDLPVVLPPQLNAEDLETMLDELDVGRINELTGLDMDPEQIEQIKENDSWSGDYSLMATDMGTYRIVFGSPGDPKFKIIHDKNGNVLELNALEYLGIRP